MGFGLEETEHLGSEIKGFASAAKRCCVAGPRRNEAKENTFVGSGDTASADDAFTKRTQMRGWGSRVQGPNSFLGSN